MAGLNAMIAAVEAPNPEDGGFLKNHFMIAASGETVYAEPCR